MTRKHSKTIAIMVLVGCTGRLLMPGYLMAQSLPDYSTQDQDEQTYARMQTRRSMLEWHQITGLLTWGLWLATNMEGERISGSHQRVGQDTMDLLLLSDPQKYSTLYLLHRENAEWHTTASNSTHVGLAAATAGMYLLTASLALFAPSVYDEKEHTGWDSVWWHKTLAVLHFAAMAALPAMAHAAEEGPAGVQAMRNVGWAGFGVFSVAIGVFYF